MFYGNCISYKNLKHIKILKETGFDYIETSLAPLYTAAKSEITDFLSALGDNNIKCGAVNVLFPGDISLTGDNTDQNKIKSYISEVFEKTKDFGFKSVVFGSGGARKVPNGFDRQKATGQIIQVIYDYLIPAAEAYNFTLAIEELNKTETNILNSVGEVEYIINQINNPRVKLLADLYHIALENDDVAELSQKGGILEHCHIANPYNNRFYPQITDSEESINLYKKFFGSLKSAGYNKKISIEGAVGRFADSEEIKNTEIPGWVDDGDKLFYTESKNSLEFMKNLE
ncbi:MAG: sugar phosphate isomerase/epimerase [Oscillospiraceae bacterium]|nr:sugar phosphate isomerase/epimerase [Oscillospiraceae bacterium]